MTLKSTFLGSKKLHKLSKLGGGGGGRKSGQNPKEQQFFSGTTSLKVDVKCSNIAVNQGGCFVSKRTKVKNKRR